MPWWSAPILVLLSLAPAAEKPASDDLGGQLPGLEQDGSDGAEQSRTPPDEGVDLASGSGVRVATTCTNCNAATLRVNGLQGDHVGVRWDGLPNAGGLADVHVLTQVPEDLVGHGEVHRGPGSVLSGDSAIGGSIGLHSVPRDQRRLLVRTELGSEGWQQLRAGGTDRWRRVGALLFVQGARADAWDANEDGFNDVAEFERFTYQGIVDVDVAEGQVLTLGATYHGEDQVDGPGRPSVTLLEPEAGVYLHEDTFFNWREFRAGWELERDSGLRLRLQGRWSRRSQQQFSPIDVGFPDSLTFHTVDERWFGRFLVERPVGAATHLTAGLSWEEIRLAVTQVFVTPDEPGFIRDGLRHGAAFVQVDHSSSERWAWTLGARLDEYTAFGYSETTNPRDGTVTSETADDRTSSFLLPRAEVRYRPSSKLVLSAALGRGSTGPRPAFEETCCGARYQRSLDLEPERAWALQLQAEWHPTPAQRLIVTGFRTEFDDYHERIVYQSQAAIPYYKKAALPEARSQGFDLIHDHRFLGDRLTVGWSFTYTDSEVQEALTLSTDADVTDWECRGMVPPLPIVLDQAGSPLRYTPEHAGTAYLRWDDARRGTKVGVDVTYTGTSRHFRIGADGGPPPDWTRAACSPWGFLETEPFWTVDISWEQRLGRSAWTLHAGVDNVFDHVMPDLGEFESAWDWGPLQGRFLRAGATWRLGGS